MFNLCASWRGFIAATILLFAVLSTGCVQPYSAYYVDQLGGRRVADVPELIPYAGEPQVITSANDLAAGLDMYTNGYAMIGYSAFNGPVQSADGAIQQAKKLQAEVILLSGAYRDTISGSVPVITPKISTVTGVQSGVVSTPYGTANYHGTSSSTVYDTTTTYYPYHVDRYDQFASYWVRMRPPVFGAWVLDLSTDLQQKLGRNKGAIIQAVLKQGPAFNANLLPGDVITEIAGETVSDGKSVVAIVGRHAGNSVTVSFVRNGQPMQQTVKLNQRP